MIIDSHQHLWRRARGDYGWLTADLGCIYRDFEPSDLVPHLAANEIDRTVLVQAAPTMQETEYLLSIAETHEFIAGVVGWVDMESRSARQQIAKLSEREKFVGIRPMLQDMPDPEWMLKDELADAYESLIELNLTLDALVKTSHLPSLLKLVQRYPDLKVVIDHAAKPDIRSGSTTEWFTNIATFAAMPQVHCKLSGLLTEAGADAGARTLAPYFQHLNQVFGCNRLMWGSDWPVLNLASDYSRWHTIACQLLEPLSNAERERIWGITAERFYGLEGSPPIHA